MYYFGIVCGWEEELGSSQQLNYGFALELISQYILTGDYITNGNTEVSEEWQTFPINRLQQQPGWRTVDVPDEFEIYFCQDSGGQQNFLIWKMVSPPAGKLALRKSSANPSITG